MQFDWTYRLDCSPSLDPWLQALVHQSVTCFQKSLCIFYLCNGNRRNSYENDNGNDNDNDNNNDADDVNDDNNDNDDEDDDE